MRDQGKNGWCGHFSKQKEKEKLPFQVNRSQTSDIALQSNSKTERENSHKADVDQITEFPKKNCNEVKASQSHISDANSKNEKAESSVKSSTSAMMSFSDLSSKLPALPKNKFLESIKDSSQLNDSTSSYRDSSHMSVDICSDSDESSDNNNEKKGNDIDEDSDYSISPTGSNEIFQRNSLEKNLVHRNLDCKLLAPEADDVKRSSADWQQDEGILTESKKTAAYSVPERKNISAVPERETGLSSVKQMLHTQSSGLAAAQKTVSHQQPERNEYYQNLMSRSQLTAQRNQMQKNLTDKRVPFCFVLIGHLF